MCHHGTSGDVLVSTAEQHVSANPGDWLQIESENQQLPVAKGAASSQKQAAAEVNNQEAPISKLQAGCGKEETEDTEVTMKYLFLHPLGFRTTTPGPTPKAKLCDGSEAAKAFQTNNDGNARNSSKQQQKPSPLLPPSKKTAYTLQQSLGAFRIKPSRNSAARLDQTGCHHLADD